ncbi:NAD(P)H-dependent oxidoreductase [Dyella caseinilytica]|uniref:NAD(P)H-dependent oxidoreductase n=2 Tax=Dyella caseinilytica TaxID=1849581 RepID=A0ABX7GZZ7_9GAMM|nr:NAD(P)H-dependent oxidoreductase [Dyella caseinilytica]
MPDEQKPVVLLIMGSVRAGRNCPRIAHWAARIGHASTDLAYEVIDLADWSLPMDDEPGLPHAGEYIQSHTHAWSEKVRSAAAVVFVTPQYNWGYPAPLKNAIDHLYSEWRGKPTAIISYGGHGGSKCAKQLRQVGAGLKMRVMTTAPALTLSEKVIHQQVELDPEVDLASYAGKVRKAFKELSAEIRQQGDRGKSRYAAERLLKAVAKVRKAFRERRSLSAE